MVLLPRPLPISTLYLRGERYEEKSENEGPSHGTRKLPSIFQNIPCRPQHPSQTLFSRPTSSRLCELPDEITEYIISRFSPLDRVHCTKVCRMWCALTDKEGRRKAQCVRGNGQPCCAQADNGSGSGSVGSISIHLRTLSRLR